jgi:hypothetical protein
MKYLFCIDKCEDLRKMQEGQIDSLATAEGVEIHKLVIGKEDQQETILDYLENFSDDEYIVFVPAMNLLVSPVAHSKIQKLAGVCEELKADYCRLRRIHSNQKIRSQATEHVDYADIFYICPHIFKVSALKDSISRVASGQMFWYSLETKDLSGIFYYSEKENAETRAEFSYYVCQPFNTLSEVVDINGKWQSSFIQHNKNILETLITEYNLEVDGRSSSKETINECCGQ